MPESILGNEQLPTPWPPKDIAEPEDDQYPDPQHLQALENEFMEGVFFDAFLDDDHDRMLDWAHLPCPIGERRDTTVKVLDVSSSELFWIFR